MELLTQPWGARDITESSSVKDYLTVGSSVYNMFNNPSQYGRVAIDENFDPTVHKAEISKYPESVQANLLGTVSEDHYQNVKARNDTYIGASKRIEQDNPWIKYPSMLAASLLDPVNLIPVAGTVGKVNTLFNATSMIGRMATTGLAVGAVGAASNVASEALFEAQDMPTDYTTAAIYGFVLGGGMGGLAEGVSRSMYKGKLKKALAGKDDFITQNNTKITWSKDAPEDLARGDVPRMTGYTRNIPDWMKSPTATGWASPLQTVRNTMARLSNPSVALNGHTTAKTAADEVVRLNGELNSRVLAIQMMYRDARTDGYKGTMHDFLEDTGKELMAKASEQEIAVKSDIDYIKQSRAVNKLESDMQKDLDEQLATLDNMKANKADKANTEEFKQAKEDLRKEIKAKYEPKMEEARQKLYDIEEEFYRKNSPKFSPNAAKMNEYFQVMKDKGKAVGIPEFEHIPDSRTYMPRQWAFEALKGMSDEDLAARLFEAFRAHPSNANKTDEVLKEYSMIAAMDLKKRGFDRSFNDKSYFVDSNRIGNDKSLRSRKLSIDAAKVQDLMIANAGDVMGGYHYWMRGQIAVRDTMPELRGKSVDEIVDAFHENYVRPIHSELASREDVDTIRAQKDMAALDYVFKDLLGYERIPTNANSLPWVATRLANQMNAITYSGMFGLNQLLEIPSAMWATGFNRLFHKQFGDLFTETINTIAKDTSPKSEFLKELANMGFMETMISNHGVNRIADTQSVFNVSKLENNLFGFTHKLYKYNGMRAMTAWLEAIVASNAVTKVLDTNWAKLGKKDRLLMNQWGLDDKALLNLQKELNRVGDIHNGYIKKLGLSEMNPKAQESLSMMIRRSIESGVIQGDTFHLPRWITTPQPLVRLMTQFMRFPIAANEILLAKGFDQDTAGWAASTLGAYMMSMGMFYILEQADMALGNKGKVDQRYDLKTDDGLYNLIMKSTNYVGGWGAMQILYDQSMLWTGQPQLGRDYAQREVAGSLLGVTGNRINNIPTMMDAILNGRFDDQRAWMTAKGFFMPLNNYPILGNAFKNVIEDNTYKY